MCTSAGQNANEHLDATTEHEYQISSPHVEREHAINQAGNQGMQCFIFKNGVFIPAIGHFGCCVHFSGYVQVIHNYIRSKDTCIMCENLHSSAFIYLKCFYALQS